MKAKEARVAAEKRASELKKQREESERKAAAKAAEDWRKQRAQWQKDELKYIKEDIEEAVKKGKTKISVHLRTFDTPQAAEMKEFLKHFEFTPELKRVIAHFRRQGYKLKFKVEPYENIDLSDLNPRDNWTTYQTMLEVSW